MRSRRWALDFLINVAGLIGFATAWALELAPVAIMVNPVCPGWVDTGFNAAIIRHLGGEKPSADIVESGAPLGRQGQPRDVAQTFPFLASPGVCYTTVQALIVDGGVCNGRGMP